MKRKALILGGSGSVGYSCAKILAANNYDLIIVHRVRKMQEAECNEKFELLRELGSSVTVFNKNACIEETINEVCNYLKSDKIDCFIHAIADGNVGNVFNGSKIIRADSFLHTFNTMCVSFATWSQMLVENKILQKGGNVIGFTSAGSKKTFPQYVANGVAKAGLETLCLYMSEELKSCEIAVNIIRAGIMDTNAIKVFDSYEALKEMAVLENPNHKLTNPNDVAKVVFSLLSNTNMKKTGEIIDLLNGDL